MAVECIEAPWLDLDLSMYPSFLSSLYRYEARQHWVKVLGPGAGTVLYMNDSRLCCKGLACSRVLLKGVSGEWCLEECQEGLRGHWIAGRYRGLVVSTALEPVDKVLVAASVVLSRRTRYAINVRRWMRKIFAGIESIDPGSLAEAAARAAEPPSPQPRHLAKVLPRLANIVLEERDPWLARKKLLELPGIGPKTADAILLFTGLTTRVAPCDTHLARFATEMLGLQNVRVPSKSTCLRYVACPECPLRTSCLSGVLVEEFGAAAGLVQTMAYVYGRLGVARWRTKLYEELEKHYNG